MRFQFLTKVPRYKRFEFTPRYYDEVEDEMKQRMKRLKREGHLDPKEEQSPVAASGETSPQAPSEPGLQRGFITSQSRSHEKADFTRLIIVVLLLSGGLGWLYQQPVVMYGSIFLFIAYLWLRIRRRS